MNTDYATKIKNYTTPRRRIWELDCLRGFCIVLMIIDHLAYNLVTTFAYFGSNPVLSAVVRLARIYFSSSLREIGWIVAVFIFVFLCGISSSLTKNNLLRGIKLLALAYLVTVATSIMDLVMGSNSFAINFGVLHLLGFCILIYALCVERAKLLKLFTIKGVTVYLSDLFILILVGVVIVLTTNYSVPFFFMGRYPMYTSIFELSFGEFYNFILGISPNLLPSSDYIPLLPWLSAFLLGAFFGAKFYPTKTSLFPSCNNMNDTLLAKIGRRSLLIYVVHQPIVYGLLILIGLIFTGKTPF